MLNSSSVILMLSLFELGLRNVYVLFSLSEHEFNLH